MAADEEKTGTTKPGGERRSGGDRRQRQPVTIDLKAESAGNSARASPPAPGETAAGEPAKAPAEPAQPKEEVRLGRAPAGEAATVWNEQRLRVLLAGVAGGLVALVLIIVLQGTGLVPVPGGSAAKLAIERAETASNAASGLDRRLMALEAMTEDLPAVRSDIAALATKLTVLETEAGLMASRSDVEAIRSELAGLEARLDTAPRPASEQGLAGLASRVGRLEALPPAGGGEASGATTSALAGRLDDVDGQIVLLSARIDAIEAGVSGLSAAEARAGGETAALAIAVVSLRRAAEAGEPFAADLDMVAALGLSGTDINELRRFAKGGVATRAALAAQFPAAADDILAVTTQADPNAGALQRLVGSVRGLVSIRSTEPVAGNDPPAIVSRMRAAVAAGDLAAALAERDGLPAAGLEASQAWATQATDRLAVERLIDAIARPPGEAAGE